MFRKIAGWVSGMLLGTLLFGGCNGIQKEPSVYREGVTTPSGEPAYITVQHCLIGFEGSVPGKVIVRSESEAEKLAQELLAKAQAGDDFAALVASHTDDSPPGIYKMANTGFPGDMTSSVPSNHVYARDAMVPAFGNTGFPLEVGQVGLAVYDKQNSPFGWHIVKRIK
jgi:hypothetical protein